MSFTLPTGVQIVEIGPRGGQQDVKQLVSTRPKDRVRHEKIFETAPEALQGQLLYGMNATADGFRDSPEVRFAIHRAREQRQRVIKL